eukprot:SAG22_NODE_1618_length_3971_cov_2.707645_6_plen_51_part_00
MKVKDNRCLTDSTPPSTQTVSVNAASRPATACCTPSSSAPPKTLTSEAEQ